MTNERVMKIFVSLSDLQDQGQYHLNSADQIQPFQVGVFQWTPRCLYRGSHHESAFYKLV